MDSVSYREWARWENQYAECLSERTIKKSIENEIPQSPVKWIQIIDFEDEFPDETQGNSTMHAQENQRCIVYSLWNSNNQTLCIIGSTHTTHIMFQRLWEDCRMKASHAAKFRHPSRLLLGWFFILILLTIKHNAKNKDQMNSINGVQFMQAQKGEACAIAWTDHHSSWRKLVENITWHQNISPREQRNGSNMR